MNFVQPLSGINRPCQTAQQLATVLNIPVAYICCDDNDRAEILLQITSASGDHTLLALLAVKKRVFSLSRYDN
jgi:hypothetical protein